jgi:hypothetical protein
MDNLKEKKQRRQKLNNDTPHYVSNKEFTEAMTAWCLENKNADGTKKPRKDWTLMPDFIAICFMKIIEHYALKGNWRNYSYIDEMKSEARLNCIKYAHNFDTERGNAFAYFTQYVHNSFLQILAVEKKQAVVKYHDINEQSIYSLDKINLYDEDYVIKMDDEDE